MPERRGRSRGRTSRPIGSVGRIAAEGGIRPVPEWMGRRASRSGIAEEGGICSDLERTGRIVPGSGPSFVRVREKSFISEEEGSLLELHNYQNRDGSELPLLESALFSPFSGIRHAYATRLGGVSEGEWSSMNLSFTRGDW